MDRSSNESHVLGSLSDAWATVSSIAASTGLDEQTIKMELRRLVDNGDAVYESRGGRHKRTAAKVLTVMEVDIEIIGFLDEQYEPVGAKEIAKHLVLPVRQTKTDLSRLQREGHVLCVQEEDGTGEEFVPSLWVSL